jgi:hypothetical protein
MIVDRKMMVTIVWNPQGLHRVVALPKGPSFTVNYDIDRILQSLWRVAQLGVAQISSFMRTMRDLIPLENSQILPKESLRNGAPSTILTRLSAV